jgi:nucleoside 2-deoxyribosyltransferase
MRWQDITDDREKYAAYLCSREWSALKEQVRSRSGGICERCTVHYMDHVHHLTYKRKYAEQLDDLQACCKQCHEFIHAKSQNDPARDRPAVLPWCKTRVKSFYLAGKITGTTWRDTIVDEWSFENHSFAYYEAHLDYEDDGLWAVVPSACEVLDGVDLDYTGPWWKDPYGHGLAQDSEYPHGYSLEGSDKSSITSKVMYAIVRSDLVFAWIDSHDCYGTLLEIGLAIGLNKTVVAVFSDAIDTRELWLTQATATYSLTAKTPRDGWDEFWRLVAFEQKSPSTACTNEASKTEPLKTSQAEPMPAARRRR